MNRTCKLNCDHVLRNAALKLAAMARELEKLANEIDREPDEPKKKTKRVSGRRRKASK